MRWQQFAQKIISECISLARVPKSPKTGLRVVSYHSVGGEAFGDDLGLSTISIELFKQHALHLANYKIITTNNCNPLNNQLSVAITFDDGYKDNLYTAAPILLERSLPFTVFIATDLVSKKAFGFLTPNELKELAKYPDITIGAHGKTHTHLTKLKDSQIYSELRDSKSYLEDLLGIQVNSMSYPYGDVDERVMYAADLAGYKYAFTSKFAINNSLTGRLNLNRCAILKGDSTRTLIQKINGDWDWRGMLGTNPV
jgi:peptidoglycan/xylan/chitin deacetylase (PgdA/CDA1 family)